MTPQQFTSDDLQARRKMARRTALWIALVAAVIYGGFILGGALR
ncbi:hypothetical protein [Luteimonas aquatica]|nr:hypothetical protein [Luteimonas aquatica]